MLARLVGLVVAAWLSVLGVNSHATSLTYPHAFVKGWNLVGNSVAAPLDVKASFGPLATSTITSVWKWNASTSRWAFYAPSLDTAGSLASYCANKGYDVLTTVEQGEGFWVNADAATTLGTQSGSGFVLTAANLTQGWNLAATGEDITPAAFGAAVGDVTTLWAWDNVSNAWYFYAPSLAASNGLASYISNKGYQDFGSNTLGNGRGFWVNYAGATIANVAPVANAGAAQNVTTGTLVTLDGSASSDANSDALTYAWTLTSKPEGSSAALSSTASAKPTFTADLAGTYVISLLVSDGKVSSTATSVTTTASALKVIKVVTGPFHALALKEDGSLWAWGENIYGVLGDGTNININTPKKIDSDYIDIYTGAFTSFGIKSDGSLWAWGSNEFGSFGDGTTQSSLIPKKVGDGFTKLAIDGVAYVAALKSDGSLWNWGLKNLSPVKFADDFSDISVGGGYTVVPNYTENYIGNGATVAGIKTDGSLWTWGAGYLGYDTSEFGASPKLIGYDFKLVSVNSTHALALKKNGDVWSWGFNASGALGIGDTLGMGAFDSKIPMLVGGSFAQVSVGREYSTALKTDGSLWAWGAIQFLPGGLGYGDSTVGNTSIPKQIGSDFMSISNGEYFSVAIKTDGSVWVWGCNSYGSLGDSVGDGRTPQVIKF